LAGRAFPGIGSTHTLSDRAVRKSRKEPIGFVHFPDKPKAKSRRAPKAHPKPNPKGASDEVFR